MFEDKDYEELTEMLRDAIEARDIVLYNKVLAEMNYRTSHYE